MNKVSLMILIILITNHKLQNLNNFLKLLKIDKTNVIISIF